MAVRRLGIGAYQPARFPLVGVGDRTINERAGRKPRRYSWYESSAMEGLGIVAIQDGPLPQHGAKMMTEEYGTRIYGGDGPTAYSLIDTDMLDSLRRYIFRGIPPGHFLTAVLENNLKEAVGRADHENIMALPAFVSLLYNDAPARCWGSPEKVAAWRGIEGKP